MTLLEKIDRLGEDEKQVLELLVDRLTIGFDEYGALDIRADPRNWTSEQLDEVVDLMAYRLFNKLLTEIKSDECRYWKIQPRS
jgi:hypothetical protein